MDNRTAIKVMLLGKKITDPELGPGEYLYMNTQGIIMMHYSDGEELESESFNYPRNTYEIYEETQKIDIWINIYSGSLGFVHPDKAEADRQASKDRIACVHVVQEYKEGEGL